MVAFRRQSSHPSGQKNPENSQLQSVNGYSILNTTTLESARYGNHFLEGMMKRMTMPMRQVRYMHLAGKIADMLGITRSEFEEFRALTRTLRRSAKPRSRTPKVRRSRRAAASTK
jgi:hypothetical protein